MKRSKDRFKVKKPRVDALVREAEGLSGSQALFLYTIASRGAVCTGSTETNLRTMRLSRPTYYRVRKELEDKGLITVVSSFDPRRGRSVPTQISINVETLMQIQTPSHSETVSERDGLSARNRHRLMVRQSHSDNTEVLSTTHSKDDLPLKNKTSSGSPRKLTKSAREANKVRSKTKKSGTSETSDSSSSANEVRSETVSERDTGSSSANQLLVSAKNLRSGTKKKPKKVRARKFTSSAQATSSSARRNSSLGNPAEFDTPLSVLVREYTSDNPSASLGQIATHLSVSIEEIQSLPR